ncbi:MAG: LPS assembly lipoprotein LptE [Gammaproteobacteria bacterium]|jgi:LPS-assembly lipoprotein
MATRLFKSLLVALLLPVLSGCGFSLRGSDALSASLPELQLYLQQPGDEIAGLLRRALQDANVAVTEIDADTVNPGLPVLIVGAEQRRIRPITVTPRARAAQYDIRMTLPVSMIQGENQLLGPEDLIIQQVYYENTGNITGTLEEREVIQSELRRELVNRLLRRLEAATSNGTAS